MPKKETATETNESAQAGLRKESPCECWRGTKQCGK
jgi:hypothetical protein